MREALRGDYIAAGSRVNCRSERFRSRAATNRNINFDGVGEGEDGIIAVGVEGD